MKQTKITTITLLNHRDMIDFCIKVRKWLSEKDDHVIAVHCKGGKGRTGTMICTWLVDCDMFTEAEVGTRCVYHDTMEHYYNLLFTLSSEAKNLCLVRKASYILVTEEQI